MKKFGDVRSVSGTPVANDFANSGGTPLVIDIASGTGYYMDAAGAVQSLAGGGGGGAPTGATYVVLSLDGGLSAERVLTAGAGITITDGGANEPVTIAASGGSTASGAATLDFGGAPTAETDIATVAVADAGVAAGSEIALSLQYAATADHTADEALITPIHLVAGNISAGVGFDIKGYCPNQAWGKFSVAWVRS